jgi:hypothetical protein
MPLPNMRERIGELMLEIPSALAMLLVVPLLVAFCLYLRIVFYFLERKD